MKTPRKTPTAKFRPAFVLLLALSAGCQTEIEIEPPEYKEKTVIEGTIENGRPPVVMLTKSIPYFTYVDTSYLKHNFLVTDATVTVAPEGGEEVALTLQFCPESPFFLAYTTQGLVGRENTSYTLKVECGDTTYTAVTRIPHTFDLDSIGFDTSMELLGDSLATIRSLLTDNGDEQNFYTFSVKLKCPALSDRQWVHCLPLAFDDRAFNGQTFNYEIMRSGPSLFLMPEMSEAEQAAYLRMAFRPGDTVYVKHSQVDYRTYRFLMTGGMEAVYGTNPFMNPAPVESNIVSGNGTESLGNWSGYASKTDTLVWHTR